jgi:hypothetical protein
MTKLLRKLDDPEIDDIKISSKEHFELVYMRHMYFRKSTNPEPGRLEKFEEMLQNIANKIYMRNIQVFKTVGFEMEDLHQIARVHTVSFISMGGLYENPEKMEKFRQRHKKLKGEDSEPTEYEIFKKECYDLARFLNQRIQETAKFCKIKNTNIRGTKNQKKFYIGDPTKNPSDIQLFENAKYYGFKKITEKRYKELVKENKVKNKQAFLTNDNQMVRAVYIKGSFLTEQDLENTDIDSKTNQYYQDPLEAMLQNEEVLLKDKLLKE